MESRLTFMGTECQLQVFSTYSWIKVIVLISVANVAYSNVPHLQKKKKKNKLKGDKK